MINRKTLIQIENNGEWTMYSGPDNGEPLSMTGRYDSHEEAVSRAIDLAYLNKKYGRSTNITINTRTHKEMMACE